jgi:hypothetical protein
MSKAEIEDILAGTPVDPLDLPRILPVSGARQERRMDNAVEWEVALKASHEVRVIQRTYFKLQPTVGRATKRQPD